MALIFDGPIFHRDPIVPLIIRQKQDEMVISFVSKLFLHANIARSPVVAYTPEANAFNFQVYKSYPKANLEGSAVEEANHNDATANARLSLLLTVGVLVESGDDNADIVA